MLGYAGSKVVHPEMVVGFQLMYFFNKHVEYKKTIVS